MTGSKTLLLYAGIILRELMKLNLKSLAWWLTADAVVIIVWKLVWPDTIDGETAIALTVSSIILYSINERKRK